MAGGPPCQPFSLGGKHRADRDDRDMFPYAIQAIARLQPRAFVFENVKGLLRQAFADYFEYLLLRLTYPSFTPDADWRQHRGELRNLITQSHTGIKYDVQFKLVNAANYGVPQTRERVVIVGIRSDLKQTWQFPAATHSADNLFWDMYGTGDYWERHKIAKAQRLPINPSIAAKVFRLQNKQAIPNLIPWRTVRDAVSYLPHPQSHHRISDHIFRDGARIYPGHTGSILDAPAKTIKAGDHGVPGGENMVRFPDGTVRYMTILEAKRLQTFPDDFVIQGVWGEAMRQIGNAVPVQLSATIGCALMNTLNAHRPSSVEKS